MEQIHRQESRELPKYELNIIIHRHGPKIGTEGPLSEEGKEFTQNYFNQAYDGVIMDETSGIQVEHSPIHRTKQSARIYSEAIERTGSGKIDSITEDERLSEGGIAANKEILNKLLKTYGRGGKWIQGWIDMAERPSPEVKTGSEAVSDFSAWLLEKVGKIKEEGGKQEIDAFSHGPVILAFLIKLQKETKRKILPEGWKNKDIFSTTLNYLSNIHIWTDSDKPEEIILRFNNQNHTIPIKVIEKL